MIASVPVEPVSEPQRFRKKPVEIEAMRWDGSKCGATSVIAWIQGAGSRAEFNPAPFLEREPPVIVVQTLEGPIPYPPHYTFIRGVKGEFYACEDAIFDATYEPVSETGKQQANEPRERRLIREGLALIAEATQAEYERTRYDGPVVHSS